MKTAVVCGGAGFIGTHLCDKLRREGYYVTAIDKKMSEFDWRPADQYHIFDLTNAPAFFASFQWNRYDEVYQLAANMGGADFVFSGKNDADIVRESAMINLNVLEACRAAGTKKIFFASSACVYESLATGTPPPDCDPITACAEWMAGNPDSPYGAEKLFSEVVYASYARQYGMQVRIGRFHNVFGSHGTWRGGREKSPAAFCRKIAEANDFGMNGFTPIILCYGDGEQTRSFLHASEAVDAVYRLMQSDFQGPVNIGSSEMVSINQMIAMIGEIANKKFTVKHIDGPLGVRGRNSDNSLISEKLGWKPTKTLREGLEPTYRWIAEQVEKRRKDLLTRQPVANSV